MSKIQAVIFQRANYSPRGARKYLKDNGLKRIKRVHKTHNFLRYVLEDPKKYSRFASKKIAKDNLQIIVGFEK